MLMKQFVEIILKKLAALPKTEDNDLQHNFSLFHHSGLSIENHPANILLESNESYTNLLSLLDEHKNSEIEVTTEALAPFKKLLADRWETIKKSPLQSYTGGGLSVANRAFMIVATEIDAASNNQLSNFISQNLMPSRRPY